MSALSSIIDPYVDAYFRFRPGEATEKGYAAYDGRAASLGPADIEAFRGAVERARAALAELSPARLDSDDAIDLAALEAHLATALFEIDERNVFATSPIAYVLPALDSIEALEIQGKGGDALLTRLRGVTPLMAQARAQVDVPFAPFRDVALEMLTSGVEHLAERFSREVAAPEIAAAADDARRAMGAYAEHLEKGPTRPFEPMGEEAYLFLLEKEHLLDEGLDPLLTLAHETLTEVSRTLDGIDEEEERELPVPEGFGRQDVLDYYQAELKAVRQFVVDKQLLTLPRGKLVLRETPEYLRALIPGVSYLPPPAFSGQRQGYLYVRPVPHEMDEEDRRRSYERVHHRWFRNTIAHEVWPGHHVQLLRASAHPSAIRKFRDNDVMVEGWGLYSEALVREQGMWEGDVPEGAYQALKFRAARVIVDIGVHTGRMTIDQAIDWMVGQFAEGARDWITAEVRRYANEPTQAMSYLVGQRLIMNLREEWRDLVGHASFELRRFHDELLGEGSIPIPLIRRKMLALATNARATTSGRG